MEDSIQATIRKRFSCRVYQKKPIHINLQKQLKEYLHTKTRGPFGSRLRFKIIAASQDDRKSLKGLGTYGFIKNPQGFIVGAVLPSSKGLEDYGYRMEEIILFATNLGLGTCWLGGSFTKSNFAQKIGKLNEETVPAVTSIGYIFNSHNYRSTTFRKVIEADRRKPWNELFFQNDFNQSLSKEEAGDYVVPLEMVRIAPSASNKQPWRIIKKEHEWYFYLQRTTGYGQGSMLFNLLGLADLQRVDMGIAMCHFEATAKELGLEGQWRVNDPGIAALKSTSMYIASWLGK